MELFKEVQSGCEADFFQPLVAYLRAKRAGRITPPYIPHWDHLPLHKLCRLALLWQEAGFEKEAAHLTHSLLPLEPFLPLWCPEKEYDEKELKHLFSLLRKIEPISGSAFPFDVAVTHAASISTAFTLSGKGSSLGVIRTPDIEIRAFGPQTASLNFGIQGKGLDGWTQSFASAEVWLEMKTKTRDKECVLDLRFIGLKPEDPLSFAFYVKAASCQIGTEILKPKSLRRFIGEESQVKFNQTLIQSAVPHKVQVIPLAGEGCFWDCEFLVSFEMHPFAPQATFVIHHQVLLGN